MRERKPTRGDLPWGWWLRASRDHLEDEHGRRWRSVRHAFWEGDLGFPEAHFAWEQHELLLRVLASIDSQWVCTSSRPSWARGG